MAIKAGVFVYITHTYLQKNHNYIHVTKITIRKSIGKYP